MLKLQRIYFSCLEDTYKGNYAGHSRPTADLYVNTDVQEREFEEE